MGGMRLSRVRRTAALPPEALATVCRPEDLPFAGTDRTPELESILGQPRALRAIRFGLEAGRPGYNLFVLGSSGIGKHSAVMRLLGERAAQAPVPPDLCYVAQFAEPAKPRLLRLPAGRGAQLRGDMRHLVEELGGALPAALDNPEFRRRLRQIDARFERTREAAIQALRDKAEAQGIKLFEQPGEFTFAPLHEGQVLDMAAFERLPDDLRKTIEDKVSALQTELTRVLEEQVPAWQRDRRAALRTLRHATTRAAVRRALAALRGKYADLPEVMAYLDDVERHAVQNAREFLQRDAAQARSPDDRPALRDYEVNLLVDHSATRGAPVVWEDNPTFTALVGRIEHQAQFGTLITDFNLIRAGALHRANGGYLVLDARKLLTQPFAWEALKRALQAGELRMESFGQAWSLISTVSLEPQPLPLDVKLVLEGDRLLYYLLQAYDPDFVELFKVAADFEDSIARTPESLDGYMRLIATLARKERLRAFDRTAVAALIDHSARLAGDAAKLSTCMRDVLDVMHEADYCAAAAQEARVGAAHVAQALAARIARADRVRDVLHEEIRRGILHIATGGKTVGQVNGLSVLDAGTFSFGLPARISATTRLGEGEVVDIEREVDMGGPVHSKGVFILSSFLGARYAQNFPLSLSASLAFEQSYSGVEGDSASLAELCALLSSLSGIALDQAIAVTGSVDQLGHVQAVGGVNEKIEGFFDVCAQRGLSGNQGVIIPRSNVQHLMLRADVVDAVRAGRFHVYAVGDVDTAMELLGDGRAGRAGRHGEFAAGTINGRVQQRLAEFARLRMAFSGVMRETPGGGADSTG